MATSRICNTLRALLMLSFDISRCSSGLATSVHECSRRRPESDVATSPDERRASEDASRPAGRLAPRGSPPVSSWVCFVFILVFFFVRVRLESSRAERTLERSERSRDIVAVASKTSVAQTVVVVSSITPRTTRVEPPWPPFPSFQLCADAWTRWSPCARRWRSI